MGDMTIDRHPLGAASEGTADLADLGRPAPLRTMSLRQAIGAMSVVAGVVAVLVGWWGVAGTPEQWKQLSYLASGGVLGGVLVVIGVTLFISYEHARDREVMATLLERLDGLESSSDRVMLDITGIAARLDEMSALLRPATTARGRASSRTTRS